MPRRSDLYASDGMTQLVNKKHRLAQRAAVARMRKRWYLTLYYEGVVLGNNLVSGTKKEAMAKAEKVVAARPHGTLGKLTNQADPSNVAAWKSLRQAGSNGRGRSLFTKRTLRLV